MLEEFSHLYYVKLSPVCFKNLKMGVEQFQTGVTVARHSVQGLRLVNE